MKVKIQYLTLKQIKAIDRRDPFSAAAVEPADVKAGWYWRERDGRALMAPVGPFETVDDCKLDCEASAKSHGLSVTYYA